MVPGLDAAGSVTVPQECCLLRGVCTKGALLCSRVAETHMLMQALLPRLSGRGAALESVSYRPASSTCMRAHKYACTSCIQFISVPPLRLTCACLQLLQQLPQHHPGTAHLVVVQALGPGGGGGVGGGERCQLGWLHVRGQQCDSRATESNETRRGCLCQQLGPASPCTCCLSSSRASSTPPTCRAPAAGSCHAHSSTAKTCISSAHEF